VFNLGVVKQAHTKFLSKHKKHVRDTALFTHRTGRTWRATKARVKRFRRGGKMVVRCTTPYATFLEHGTKAHVIRPKFKKALRFRVGGQPVFARKVNHPGTRPYYFLSAARDHAYRWARSTLQARMRRIARGF
jgi:hypothetical protein